MDRNTLSESIARTLTDNGLACSATKTDVIRFAHTADPAYRSVCVWVQIVHSQLVRLTLFVNGFSEDDTTYLITDNLMTAATVELARYIEAQWSTYLVEGLFE